MELNEVRSPRFQARLAGLVALITTSSGFTAVVISNLVAYDNAAVTARNILNNELLFRFAIAGDVVAALYIVYTLLLLNLFRPVNRNVALLGAFFSLVGTALGMFVPFFALAALGVLNDAQSFSGFSTEQLQAIALLFLKLRSNISNVSLVLFGAYNMLTGWLIFKSIFMPRILGVLLAVAGFGYEINVFATLLSPAFAAHLAPWILIPGLSELLLAGWFLVVGVNVQRWKQQADLVPR
jgi:hypothetical protein